MPSALLAAVAVALAALLLVQAGCGSGGGGGGSATGAVTTGSVVVVLGDGPTEDFCGIPVTITEVALLSDEGPVSLFEGRRTVDLLRLRDNTNLLTVGQRVPARSYSKIRLIVAKLQLEECDEDGNVTRVIDVDHPSRKIDLNPRGEFTLRPGDLLLIQLDLDAERSIKAHATGSGRYRFRPVVFVDIFTGRVPKRLVLLEGVIEELDRLTGRFLLCRTHAVSRPTDSAGDERATVEASLDDPMGGDRDACVEIVTAADTSIFESDAIPADLEALEDGDFAAVLGRFRSNQAALSVAAEVVQRDPDSVERVRGTVLGPVMTDDIFDFEIDPEQSEQAGIPAEVLIQKGTKVFARNGDELAPEDLERGQRARVVGAVDLAGVVEISATYIMVDDPAERPDHLSGSVVSWNDAMRELTIQRGDGVLACATVPEEASVFLAEADDPDNRLDFVPIDPSQLPIGARVDLSGRDESPCFAAKLVIGFAGFDDD